MSVEGRPGEGTTEMRAAISQGLTLAAARSRFSNRRSRYEAGHADRVRARADRLLSAALMVLIILIPNVLSGVYFGYLASDQYVVETRLLVRPNRGLGALSGGVEALAEAEIARETQVATDYLTGPTLAGVLRAEGFFTRLYEHPPFDMEALLAGGVHPDPLAGFPPGATAEEDADYWADMARAEIELPAGVIIFSVRGFSAEGAVEAAARGLEAVDALLSSMNTTAWTDASARAEAVLNETAKRLVAAQTRLARLRDATGSLDVETEAGVATTLAGRLRETLSALERDYAAQERLLAGNAPRLRALAIQIETLKRQISEVEAQMTATPEASGQVNVTTRLARFAAAETEVEAAQAQFIEATSTLERTRQAAELRASFLDVITPPQAPQSATRPRRALWIGGVLVGSVFAYWIALGTGRLALRARS